MALFQELPTEILRIILLMVFEMGDIFILFKMPRVHPRFIEIMKVYVWPKVKILNLVGVEAKKPCIMDTTNHMTALFVNDVLVPRPFMERFNNCVLNIPHAFIHDFVKQFVENGENVEEIVLRHDFIRTARMNGFHWLYRSIRSGIVEGRRSIKKLTVLGSPYNDDEDQHGLLPLIRSCAPGLHLCIDNLCPLVDPNSEAPLAIITELSWDGIDVFRKDPQSLEMQFFGQMLRRMPNLHRINVNLTFCCYTNSVDLADRLLITARYLANAFTSISAASVIQGPNELDFYIKVVPGVPLHKRNERIGRILHFWRRYGAVTNSRVDTEGQSLLLSRRSGSTVRILYKWEIPFHEEFNP
jgi:hypothetical protein